MAPAGPAPSELLSGPDLGGGYLHQLSVDRLDASTTFTHHAQDGGLDAGGPPIGDLAPFGFVHPAAPCMFGGPRCWHRRYLLPLAEAARVRFAYQRFRLVLATMLAQAYGRAPVGFDAALTEVVRKVAGPLREEGIEWYVAGSGALRLLGAPAVPHDIDLGVARPGVARIGELLAEYLIEPVAPTDWPPSRLVRAARAFVGTPRDGARVEWSVPLEPGGARPLEEFTGTPGVARTVPVPFGGQELRVSRPEYSLVRAAVRRRPALEQAALAAIQSVGLDAELLETLLARSPVEPGDRAALCALARAGPGSSRAAPS